MPSPKLLDQAVHGAADAGRWEENKPITFLLIGRCSAAVVFNGNHLLWSCIRALGGPTHSGIFRYLPYKPDTTSTDVEVKP